MIDSRETGSGVAQELPLALSPTRPLDVKVSAECDHLLAGEHVLSFDGTPDPRKQFRAIADGSRK